MKTVCAPDACTGCRACMNVCPKNAIQLRDTLRAYNAEIDPKLCIGCGLCEKVCPNDSPVPLKAPVSWQQGWAGDDIRRCSSSGGAASAVIRAFIRSGGYVASCCYDGGGFRFALTNDPEKARAFAGSKYVKSDPGGIYREVKELLLRGEKVLFIGLPCQSAAVQNVCGRQEKLYTADLICHGTPSPGLLWRFFGERGIEKDRVRSVSFREKEQFGLAYDGKRLTPRRLSDSYTRAFLQAVDYTENCYSCRYAAPDRVSDLTFGDAWGLLSGKEAGGVSLILCQTEKGAELIGQAGLYLEDADAEAAVRSNGQLKQPSARHPGRNRFFDMLEAGRSFRLATFRALPRLSARECVKYALIRMKLLKDLPAPGSGDTKA